MSKSLRILLVHDYAPLFGGAEVVNAALVDGLRRRGHDVRRFTSTAGLDDLPADSPLRPEYACRGTRSRWRTALQSANPWAPGALRRALDDFTPDVVHVVSYKTQLSPLILPVLRRVPSLYHAVWYRAVCPTGTKLLPTGELCVQRAGTVCCTSGCVPVRDWLPLMVQLQAGRQWRDRFRATITTSHATAHVLAADGIRNITVIPNGLPDAAWPVAMADAPTAVFVGRLVREKGVDVLLQAFARLHARLPQATLDIIGDGPERSTLEALRRSLHLEAAVRFHGWQSPIDAEAIARTGWAQVVPSRWAEPFGLVAVEAMMRGAAVIASASGGLVDIVRNDATGLLVPPGEVPALSDALYRVLSDRELAASWGRRGYEVAQAEYRHDLFVDRILAVYADLLRGPRAVAR